jgi:hypothetical protein
VSISSDPGPDPSDPGVRSDERDLVGLAACLEPTVAIRMLAMIASEPALRITTRDAHAGGFDVVSSL